MGSADFTQAAGVRYIPVSIQELEYYITYYLTKLGIPQFKKEYQWVGTEPCVVFSFEVSGGRTVLVKALPGSYGDAIRLLVRLVLPSGKEIHIYPTQLKKRGFGMRYSSIRHTKNWKQKVGEELEKGLSRVYGLKLPTTASTITAR